MRGSLRSLAAFRGILGACRELSGNLLCGVVGIRSLVHHGTSRNHGVVATGASEESRAIMRQRLAVYSFVFECIHEVVH